MRKPLLPVLAAPIALVVAATGVPGVAQIQRLTLDEMVETMDDAVYGEIVASRVFRIDHPIDGPELYFTTLTIEGRTMTDASPLTVEVTFHGGFINEEEGVYNSEAPSADDVKLGNRVVVFYQWADNMGGDVAANAIVASHGGLYRTVDGPKGSTVLGRGEGYAVNANIKLTSLEDAVGTLHRAKLQQKGKNR